jgi:hypothetical protein
MVTGALVAQAAAYVAMVDDSERGSRRFTVRKHHGVEAA